jgi:ketosteroid isomerase-like protein
LDRLYNIFFKVPFFVAQYYATSKKPPSLQEIARQFNLPIKGETDTILKIIEYDQRVPKFISRDPKTGEITSVDLEKIKAKLLLIVFEDDQINSPEFAVLDREMPRVKNGRYVIVPAGMQSSGEGNNTNAGLWRPYLEDLLRTPPDTAVAGIPGSPPNQSTAQSSSAEADILAVMTERSKASIEGDVEKIASSMTDDYIQTDISGYVQNKSTWLNDYFKPLAELIKTGKFRWDVFEEKDVQIRIHGDSAVVIGRMELKGSGARPALQHTWVADPDAHPSLTLHFTRVYVKRDGKWFLSALHNAVPLQPPPPTANR